MTNAQINHQKETMISDEALSNMQLGCARNTKRKTHAVGNASLQLIDF